MPRYFFNVRDGSEMPDLDGTVFDDLDAARNEAVRYAGALLRENSPKFWEGEDWHMEVMDETGLLLFRLDFTASESPAVRDLRASTRPRAV